MTQSCEKNLEVENVDGEEESATTLEPKFVQTHEFRYHSSLEKVE